MKLTPENIAAIEDLLTRRELQRPSVLGPEVLPGIKQASAVAALTGFATVMKAIGIDVGSSNAGISSAEIAEFRKWKATQAQK